MLHLQKELTEQADKIRYRLLNDPEKMLQGGLLSRKMFENLGKKHCTNMNFGHAVESALDRYIQYRKLNDDNFAGKSLVWTGKSNKPNDWV